MNFDANSKYLHALCIANISISFAEIAKIPGGNYCLWHRCTGYLNSHKMWRTVRKVIFINFHFLCSWNLIEDLCWPQGTGRCKLQTVFCVSTRKYATNYLLHLLAPGGGGRETEKWERQALTQFCSWQCSHKLNSHISSFSVSSLSPSLPPLPWQCIKNCSYNWRNNCKSR